MITLKAQKRDAQKRNEIYRNEGMLPAIYYGKSTDSEAIVVSIGEFNKVWNEAGESTIITIQTEAGEQDALIHDVQVHPVSGEPIHVDFYIVEKGQIVTVEVPLEFIGEAPAVSEQGGVLTKVMHELEVESEPRSLPASIEVDISGLLTIGDTLAVKDIRLPNGVTATADPEEVIASVSAPQEEEETPTDAPNLEDIEVEKKGKEEEEAASE